MVEKLANFGEILSSVVLWSKDFNKPSAIVCFKNTEEAKNAFEAINSDEEFMFTYKTWCINTKDRKEM